MSESVRQLNPQRALIELEHYQRWFCRGCGRVAIENIQLMRTVLGWFNQMPGVRERSSAYIRQIRLTRFDWQFEGLPRAFDGYRILHLSDLHIDAVDGLVEAILRAVDGLLPDLVLITGDYRFETGGNNHLMIRYMKALMEGLKSVDGVYGILGNHDSVESIEPLEQLGVRMLINQHCMLERGGERMALLGLDDCHYYGTDDLDAACAGLEDELFKILMVHSPERYREAANAGIDFYLCGHTHGGQIRLPGFGAPIMNAACPRRYADRAWKHGRMQGYTHRGTGSSCVPLRLNCPPEVTVHQLSGGGTP